MISYRELRLEDREALNRLICYEGCHGADYNFANMYIWRDVYKPAFHIDDDLLLVAAPDGVVSYPMGDYDIKDVIEKLIDDAHAKGEKLVLRGLTDATLAEFLPVFEDRFEIIEDRDSADYVYTAEKLRFLAGRKLASKRNHIKHFEKNGPWEIRIICKAYSPETALTDSDGKAVSCCSIAEARAFVERFYEEKDNPDLAHEAIAIDEMFTHFDELGFVGAMLYQNGEAVAFTSGTRLGRCEWDVHFEKALPGIDGAYAMINREYVNLLCQLFPELQLINREEDMGIEGLRKAKLSYKPDILLMKYFAKEK